IRRVEIHSDVRAVEFLEKMLQRVSGFLSGFESELDAAFAEEISHPAETVDQNRELGIGVVGRQKARVKSDEGQTERFRNLRMLLDVFPIGFPSRIRNESARPANRFEA